jgi:hypothetical protein
MLLKFKITFFINYNYEIYYYLITSTEFLFLKIEALGYSAEVFFSQWLRSMKHLSSRNSWYKTSFKKVLSKL